MREHTRDPALVAHAWSEIFKTRTTWRRAWKFNYQVIRSHDRPARSHVVAAYVDGDNSAWIQDLSRTWAGQRLRQLSSLLGQASSEYCLRQALRDQAWLLWASRGNIQNIMKTSGVSFANLDYRHRLKLKQVTSTVFKRTQNQRFQVHAQAKKILDPGTRIQTILVKIFFIFFIYIMHKHIGAWWMAHMPRNLVRGYGHFVTVCYF